MKMPFEMQWMLVTPEIARAWLARNTDNRNLRDGLVRQLAADMKNGAWMPNHQGVAIRADGTLLDGQHRLSAIVMSGVSVWMLVFTNMPVSVEGVKGTMMDSIDRGAPQSVADVLRLGHGVNANPNLAHGICNAIPRIFLGPNARRVKKLTVNQILPILQHWNGPISYVCADPHGRPPGLRISPVLAAIAFAMAVDEQPVRRFFQRLFTGEGIVEGQPEHTMRHFIQEVLPVRNTATTRIRRDLTLLTLHSIDCASKGEEMPDIPNQYLGAERFIDAQRDGWDLVESVCPKFAPVRPVKTPAAGPKKASAPVPKKSASLLVAAAPSRQLSMQERIDALKASHRRVYS